MTRILFIVLAATVLTACGGAKLVVSEIRSVELEYSPGEPLNFGSRFEGRIKAIMIGGEEIDITSSRKLEFTSSDIEKSGGVFKIVRRPRDFSEDRVSYSLIVRDKEESFERHDTIVLNFRGGLTFEQFAEDGMNGTDQKERSSTWLFRDGKTGEDGTRGTDGGSGANYHAHVWKEGEIYYIHLKDLNFQTEYRYKTYGTEAVQFTLPGGSGGRGGNGGNGGVGMNGEKDKDGKFKRVGDGGTGGNGGDGGNGGTGGSITVTFHPSAAGLTGLVNFNLSGGSGGSGGRGGTGGKPGVPLSGQPEGRTGANGLQGRRGTAGIDGSPNTELVEFDINSYK